MSLKNKKTLTFTTFRDIGTYPERVTTWADVWVEFYTGKRKKQQLGPCIIALSAIKEELEACIWKQNNIKDYDSKEEFKKLCNIEKSLKNGDKFFLDNFNREMPNIYVAKEFISRKDAAEAIEWWLKKENFISKKVSITCRWKKNKIMFIGAG